MNPKLLLPISLVLGLGLLGVAGATKPLQRVQLWLDQRDGPHTATASALAPIIDCVNRIDRDTRLAYYRKRSTQPEAPDMDKFDPGVSVFAVVHHEAGAPAARQSIAQSCQ